MIGDFNHMSPSFWRHYVYQHLFIYWGLQIHSVWWIIWITESFVNIHDKWNLKLCLITWPSALTSQISTAMMLTWEEGEYLSTQGSSWSLSADSFSKDMWGSELPASLSLFLGLLGSALEHKTWLPFLLLDREKLSPGKSVKDGSTQRFS